MRHLRFSPEEYRLLAGLWHQFDLRGRSQTAIKRLLGEALSGLSPNLAKRITHLHRGELWLLCDHFRGSTPAADEHDLTPEELRVVTEACVSNPLPVRFVRHFKVVLVELFQEAWPELRGKVARLSGHQFEQLYEQVGKQRRRRG